MSAERLQNALQIRDELEALHGVFEETRSEMVKLCRFSFLRFKDTALYKKLIN